MSEPHLAEVVLDRSTIEPAGPEIEQDREVAIRDLLEDNEFQPVGHDGGPYRLDLSLNGRKLVFAIAENGAPVATHILSLTPFARIIRDYDAIRRSYLAAVREGRSDRLEAIDMGRRGVHNEGSELLISRLEGKVHMDFGTARRLFTLVCALGDGAVGRGPQL